MIEIDMENTNSIHLQYLGCSAFVISDGEGTSLALDLWTKGAFPYAEDTPEELDLGEPLALSALLVSHDHKDHCFIPAGVPVIYGVQSRKVEDNPRISQVGNINIGKFSSQHFASDTKRAKLNTVFVVTIAGVKVVHLGDAHGTMASETLLRELKQKIGDVDVLMIPIGSPWLKPVDESIVDMTIGILNPRVSLPMHYWTLSDKDKVLSGLSKLGYQLVDFQSNLVEFSAGSLPPRTTKTIWIVPAGKYHPIEIK
jgi:L-ascorbate metabolism protein UlaG (beta-lactamase superfamily)